MIKRLSASFRHHRKNLGWVALSSALYVFGFCGFEQDYLSWFCFVPLLWAIDDDSVSSVSAFSYGWFFGSLTVAGGYSWLLTMLREFGGLNIFVAALALLLFSVVHGLLWAVWTWLVHALSVRKKVGIVWTAPTALVVCEWLFPSLFPTYLANSQYKRLIFIQSADLWGPFGLSFILAMSSAVIYRVLATRRASIRPFPTAGVLVFAGVVSMNLLYGWLALANSDDSVATSTSRVRIGTVQTAMGIKDKHRRPGEGYRRHLKQSLELQRQNVDLIVWSESGYERAIPTDLKNVKRPVHGPIETPLLFGGLRIDRPKGQKRKLYNTAFLTDAAGNVLGTYDKTFLLAFGEYMPFGDWFPVLYDLSPNTSRFERGVHQRPLELNGVKYGVLICYEDVLTDFVRTAMRHEPDILINITNDAWFGRSREPWIHLALATFRAVEQRRFLVRATNTGVSAFVGPGGRIIKPTPVFQTANRVHEVVGLKGLTVYQTFGPWVAWFCIAAIAYWLRSGLAEMCRRTLGGVLAKRMN